MTTASLLNTISVTEQNMMDLQRNMTKLQQKMGETILEQSRTISDLEQKLWVTAAEMNMMNNTVKDQQRVINSLQAQVLEQNATMSKLVMDQNRTIENQHHRINALRQEVQNQSQKLSYQESYNQHLSETEDKMNRTFSAYQLILHDIVDRQNQQFDQSVNQTRVLDQKVTDLGKQFRYLSLSVLETEKKTSVLNKTLLGNIVM